MRGQNLLWPPSELCSTSDRTHPGNVLWEIAHGRSGFEFALVAAAAGVGYLVALLWFRRRG
ncbi:MAG: hypothetical protein ABIS42_03250 [Candidatus Limnocylindria bacterium]